MVFTEGNYENAVIQSIPLYISYSYTYGSDVARDYADPLYTDELMPALRRVTPKLPEVAITEAIYKLCNFEGGAVLQKNTLFVDYLQNGSERPPSPESENR